MINIESLNEPNLSICAFECQHQPTATTRWLFEQDVQTTATLFGHQSSLASSFEIQQQQQHQHHQYQYHQQQHQQQYQYQYQHQPQLTSGLARESSSKLISAQWIHNSSEAQHLLPLTQFALNYLVGPLERLDSRLDYYTSELWLHNGDQRTQQLPLMSAGPWKLIWATLVYLYIIKWQLPRWMSKRQAFELQWPIRCYNLLMVFSNCYAFYHGIRILDFGLKCFGCQVINHQDYSADAIELLHYGWLFMLSRLVEWIDTIFFVLRKKHNQVSKLHVFHHSFVPTLCWFYLKLHPGATMAFFPLVNTLVHTIMYSYYFLATFGPKVQPFLWWKKYLTSLQITQFILILIQLASISLSTNERCQYPRAFLYVAFAGAILFLWLFYTYYLDTYTPVASMSMCCSKSSKSSKAANPKPQAKDQFDFRPISSKSADNSDKLKFRPQLVANSREGASRAISDLVDNSIESDKSISSL